MDELDKVRIIVEIVSQPPFETRSMIEHKSVVIECEELAALLRGRGLGSARVIAAVPENETS